MHGAIVPAQEKLAASEGPVGLLPSVQREDNRQDIVKRWKSAFQQHSQIDALCKVVQLSAVDRQARPAREWFGQAFIKQVFNVIAHSAFNRLGALRIPGEELDFGQCF